MIDDMDLDFGAGNVALSLVLGLVAVTERIESAADSEPRCIARIGNEFDSIALGVIAVAARMRQLIGELPPSSRLPERADVSGMWLR